MASYSLSKHRVELLGDVVLLVRDSLWPELEDEVGVGLAVDVHGVQVVSLDHVHAHHHVQRVVGGETLKSEISKRVAIATQPIRCSMTMSSV